MLPQVWTEDKSLQESIDKASDMCPVGHADISFRLFQRANTAIELQVNPDTQEDKGRNFKRKDKEQYFNAGARKHDDIGAHDSRDSATGTHSGDTAIGVEIDVQGVSQEPSQEIEEQEASATDDSFDIVGKNPEKEHITQEVGPAAVQEHTGEQAEEVLALGDFRGYGTIVMNESPQLLA